MNEENVKLEKIKKSCKFGKKVATILCIIAIVGCVCSMVAGIALLVNSERFEPEFVKYVDEGKIDTSNGIGKVSGISIQGINVNDWKSDIPALQKALTERPYTTVYGIYCIIVSLSVAVCSVMIKLLSSVFELIEKEDTPFTDAVIKRVTVVMIVISGFLLLTAGAAFGYQRRSRRERIRKSDTFICSSALHNGKRPQNVM